MVDCLPAGNAGVVRRDAGESAAEERGNRKPAIFSRNRCGGVGYGALLLYVINKKCDAACSHAMVGEVKMSISRDGFLERMQAVSNIVDGMAAVSRTYDSDIRQYCAGGSAPWQHVSLFAMVSGHAEAIRSAALTIGDLAGHEREVSLLEIDNDTAAAYAGVLRIAQQAGQMSLALAQFRDEVIGNDQTSESVRLAQAANDIFVRAYNDHVAGQCAEPPSSDGDEN